MLPTFFNFNLSSPSDIATCTALHAIRKFRRQYCSRCSNADKYSLLLYFINFSYVLRYILRGRGLFHVTGLFKNLFEMVTCPLLFRSKRYQIPFAACKKGLDTACKFQKICENTRVLHEVVEYLPAPC